MSVPDLTSPNAASAYLAALPLADPLATLGRLAPYMDALAAQPLPAPAQFAALHGAEAPLALVVEDAEKRLRGRPLPFAEAETAVLAQTLALLAACADAWRRLADGLASQGPQPVGAPAHAEPAQAYERALFHRGQALQIALLARSEPPAGLWRQLHGDFAAAEAAGVAAQAWPDRKGRTVGPMRHYVATLLIDMAKPASQSFREQRQTQRWARRLAKLAPVVPLPVEGELPPFLLDLRADRSLRKQGRNDGDARGALRALDSAPLAEHLRRLKSRLKAGHTPAELGLGEGLGADECSRLLDHLRPPWSQQALARTYTPEPILGQARLITAFSALAWHLGQLAPDAARPVQTRNDFDRLVVFGSSGGQGTPQVPEAGEWGVIEQGADAWRLFHPRPPERLFHDQLVAVADSTGRFGLGRVSSLLMPLGGGLAVKVRRIDGPVAGVLARFADGGETHPALWVGHNELPALLLPRGAYRRGRLADVPPPAAAGNGRQQWRLESVLAAGADSELAAVQPV